MEQGLVAALTSPAHPRLRRILGRWVPRAGHVGLRGFISGVHPQGGTSAANSLGLVAVV